MPSLSALTNLCFVLMQASKRITVRSVRKLAGHDELLQSKAKKGRQLDGVTSDGDITKMV